MKKTLSLILALVLCLGLCACGNTQTMPDGVQLTTENYSDYMKIDASVGYHDFIEGDYIWFGLLGSSGYKQASKVFSTKVGGRICTSEVAPNYNYKDVKITVKFTGTVSIVDKNSGTDNIASVEALPFEFQGTFGLMLSGKDKDEIVAYDLPLPDNMVAVSDSSNVPRDICTIQYTWEIIEITGTVTPT